MAIRPPHPGCRQHGSQDWGQAQVTLC